MRYEIKSIGLWPFIKVSFFFNLIVGFLFGLLYALLAGFILTIVSRLSQFQPGFFEFGPIESMPIGLMIVVMPIVFAILGAIFYTIIGVILVLIYNLIARLVGGFELELAPAASAMPPPAGQPLTGYTATPTYVTPAPPGPTPPPTPSTSPQVPPPSQSPTDTNPDQPTEGKPES
jgi:hypothetical protein